MELNGLNDNTIVPFKGGCKKFLNRHFLSLFESNGSENEDFGQKKIFVTPIFDGITCIRFKVPCLFLMSLLLSI